VTALFKKGHIECNEMENLVLLYQRRWLEDPEDFLLHNKTLPKDKQNPLGYAVSPLQRGKIK
jgi:hypothetical protein